MHSNKFKKIAQEVILTEIKSLQKLRSSIGKNFNSVIETITNCKKGKIILSGVGKSGIIAKKISSTLSSVGTPSFFVDASSCSHGDLGQISSNDILIEVASLFLRVPSKETIEVLTDAKVWKVDFDAFQNLYGTIEGFTEWGRTWMTNQLFVAKNRTVEMHTQSASQRYLGLVKEKPQIIKQVPLKYIATYLGITDTSLSRIRKEVALHDENLP